MNQRVEANRDFLFQHTADGACHFGEGYLRRRILGRVSLDSIRCVESAPAWFRRRTHSHPVSRIVEFGHFAVGDIAQSASDPTSQGIYSQGIGRWLAMHAGLHPSLVVDIRRPSRGSVQLPRPTTDRSNTGPSKAALHAKICCDSLTPSIPASNGGGDFNVPFGFKISMYRLVGRNSS